MNVTVKLHTTLKKFAPEGTRGGVVPLELSEEATAKAAIEALEIPEDFVGAVFLGPTRAELDTPLTDGVELNLIAPIGGG